MVWCAGGGWGMNTVGERVVKCGWGGVKGVGMWLFFKKKKLTKFLFRSSRYP